MAAVALVAAMIAAGTRAEPVVYEYGWPSRSDAREGSIPYFAPVLLSRQNAAAVHVSVPCKSIVDAVPEAPITVAATARDPRAVRALALTRSERALRMTIGGARTANVPIEQIDGARAACSVRLSMVGSSWHLRAGDFASSGVQDNPVVTGLFSDLEPVTSGLRFTVTTEPVGSNPSAIQIIMIVTALLAATAVLWRLRNAQPARRPRARPPRPNIFDLVVGATLVLWWAIGPTIVDDGFIISRSVDYPNSGTLSSFLDHFGAQLPLGFLYHMFVVGFVQVSGEMLWLRLIPLLLSAITWLVCRRALHAVATERGLQQSPTAAVAAMTAAFLLMWLSWLNTLRPEPMVALLATTCLFATMRYLSSGRIAFLAAAGIATALAISVHPAGLVAIAPLVIAAPVIFRRVSQHGLDGLMLLGAAAATAIALGVLAVFADTDVARWRIDSSLLRTVGESYGWQDEWLRYDFLFNAPRLTFGTLARQASILVPLVAFPMACARLNRSTSLITNLSTASFVLGGLLLAFTTSKWPWQLGALAGFGALAIGVEVTLLVGERTRTVLRSLITIGATCAVVLVCWDATSSWGGYAPADPRFDVTGSGILTFDPSAIARLSVVIICAASTTVIALIWLARRRADPAAARRRKSGLRALAAWTVAGSALLIVVLTAGLFASDVAAGDSPWSIGRENLAALANRSDCGLGDYILALDAQRGPYLPRVPQHEDLAAPPVVAEARGASVTARGSDADAYAESDDIGRTFDSRTDSDAQGDVTTPWFELPDDDPLSATTVWTGGVIAPGWYRLFVEFGSAVGDDIEPTTATEVPIFQIDPAWEPHDLRSIAQPAPGSDRVRFFLVDAARDRTAAESPHHWAAVSAPRLSHFRELSTFLGRARVTTLVGPQLRPLLPCVRDPSLEGGVAQIPDFVVSDGFGPRFPESPWEHLADVYPLRELLLRLPEGVDRVTARITDRRGALGSQVPVTSERSRAKRQIRP